MNDKTINVQPYGEETLDFVERTIQNNDNDLFKGKDLKNKKVNIPKKNEKENKHIKSQIKKWKRLKKERDVWKNKYEDEKNRNTCQICTKRYRDAVLFPCLHWLYCNRCIVKWKRKNKTCPQCRTNICSILQLNVF